MRSSFDLSGARSFLYGYWVSRNSKGVQFRRHQRYINMVALTNSETSFPRLPLWLALQSLSSDRCRTLATPPPAYFTLAPRVSTPTNAILRARTASNRR